MFRCKSPPNMAAQMLDMIKEYPVGVLSVSQNELVFQTHHSDDQVLVHLYLHWSSFESFKCKEDLTHSLSPRVFYALVQYSTLRLALVDTPVSDSPINTVQIKGSDEDASLEWTLPVDAKTVILDIDKPVTADLFIETIRLQTALEPFQGNVTLTWKKNQFCLSINSSESECGSVTLNCSRIQGTATNTYSHTVLRSHLSSHLGAMVRLSYTGGPLRMQYKTDNTEVNFFIAPSD